MHSKGLTYQQELSELSIAQVLLAVLAKVQLHKLRVPVEGDVLVVGGLAEHLLNVLCKTHQRSPTQFTVSLSRRPTHSWQKGSETNKADYPPTYKL